MTLLTLNHETLMKLYPQAKNAGKVDSWVELVNTFIGQQDSALRDARTGLMEAQAQAARDRAEIDKLRGEIEQLKAAPLAAADWKDRVLKR